MVSSLKHTVETKLKLLCLLSLPESCHRPLISPPILTHHTIPQLNGPISTRIVRLDRREAAVGGRRGHLRSSHDAPGTDALAVVGRRVEPLAAQGFPARGESTAVGPDLAGPLVLVGLGKRHSAVFGSRDDLARDDVEVTARLRAAADEDGVVGGLIDLEAPVALRAVRVGKVAGPRTNDDWESRAC
jgi:hypothetical protein